MTPGFRITDGAAQIFPSIGHFLLSLVASISDRGPERFKLSLPFFLIHDYPTFLSAGVSGSLSLAGASTMRRVTPSLAVLFWLETARV